MRAVSLIACGLSFLFLPAVASAQGMQQRERAFVRQAPKIGVRLPSLSVYSADGNAFNTADLRGHYTVLTFGCLT